LLALVSYSRDAGDFGAALDYAEQLARAQDARRWRERLSRGAAV
jgi:hypothetical protein